MFLDFSPHLTDARAAYAAGLMDGEGCISIQETHRKGYFYVSVDVGMTAKALPVLRWMRSTFGGTVLARRAATEKWAAAWTWRIGGAAAGVFLRRILPALLLKAETARVAISLCELVERAEKHPNGRAIWTEGMRTEGRRLKNTIHVLNRKGPGSPEKAGKWFARLVAGLWTTPQQTLDGTSEPFSETWPNSGWMRSGRCSELTTLALRTAGSGSGSSPIYPTPSATEYGSSDQNGARREDGKRCTGLNTHVLWPTPDANEGNGGRRARAGCSPTGRMPDGSKVTVNLQAAVDMRSWPTPRAEDSESTGAHRGSPDTLTSAVRWSTPTTRDAESPAKVARGAGSLARGNELVQPLGIQVLRTWPTPTSGDAKDAGSRNVAGSLAHAGISLTDAVRGDGGRGRWPTPAASDEKGSAAPGQRRGQLSETVAGLKLSPDWVEWLMGWPVMWSSLEPLAVATPLGWAVDPGDTGEVPRTTLGVPDRRARLRAIGNGQVPACAAAAFRLLYREVQP